MTAPQWPPGVFVKHRSLAEGLRDAVEFDGALLSRPWARRCARDLARSSIDVHDQRDGMALLEALRDEVIPLYYERDRDGLPREWIARMKRAIRTLG